MKLKIFFWGLICFVFTSSFMMKPKNQLKITMVSFCGKTKLKSVAVTIVDTENRVKRFTTGKEAVLKLKLNYGEKYTLVFTKNGYESKSIKINAVPYGFYEEKTELSIDVSLARTKVRFPHPTEIGSIFFDEENNLIVKSLK